MTIKMQALDQEVIADRDNVTIEIKDRSNEGSLINNVPTYVEKALECCPDELLELTEVELEDKIGAKDVLNIRRLRIAFWNEYDRAARTSQHLKMPNVFAGVCSQGYFRKYAVGNSINLAYMLTPPVDYKVAMEEMVYLAMKHEREILTSSIINQDGEIDARLAGVKQKIAESVHNRAKGMPIHRTQSINQNLNVEQKLETRVVQEIMDLTPDQIEAQIKELNAGKTPDAEDKR